MDNTILIKKLKVLRNELKRRYPSRHYAHSCVFTAFWRLVDELHEIENDSFIKAELDK